MPSRLRRTHPPLEYIANLIVVPSYVSLERALSVHGLIPESVPLVQSITLARSLLFETQVGDFQYRHVKKDWFFGYAEISLQAGSALVATPEKALLDVVYFSIGSFDRDRIDEMRLQNIERFDLRLLVRMAAGTRIERAARNLAQWIRSELRT